MRILDEKNDISMKRVLILLTPEEASELSGAIQHILSNPNQHCHVADAAFEREITISIYTPTNLESFHERIRLLIERDQ